jgi:hypothetical protein
VHLPCSFIFFQIHCLQSFHLCLFLQCFFVL